MTDFVDVDAIKRQAAADWQRDPQLRAEFCDEFESFEAFRVADARGLVKILGRKERRQ